MWLHTNRKKGFYIWVADCTQKRWRKKCIITIIIFSSQCSWDPRWNKDAHRPDWSWYAGFDSVTPRSTHRSLLIHFKRKFGVIHEMHHWQHAFSTFLFHWNFGNMYVSITVSTKTMPFAHRIVYDKQLGKSFKLTNEHSILSEWICRGTVQNRMKWHTMAIHLLGSQPTGWLLNH